MQKSATVLLVSLLATGSLFGHPGHTEAPLFEGLAHPFGGLDHLLACALVGLLAGRMARIWTAPALFLGGLVAGLLLAATLPGMAPAGALVFPALVILVALPALDKRDLSTWLGCCLVLIGSAHGYTHALGTAPNLPFLSGMFLSSLVLIAAFSAMIKTAKNFGRSLQFQYLATAAGVLFLQVSLYAWS